MPEKKYITYHRSLIKSVSRTQISTNTITGSKVTKTTKNIYIYQTRNSSNTVRI
jgi:hypothetical protein